VDVTESAAPVTFTAFDRRVRQVKLISWLSLVWMLLEGAIGTAAGIAANSIALIGYGIDSSIAAAASLVIIWRFTGDRLTSPGSERRAQQVVAISFFLFAPYVAIEATHRLIAVDKSQASYIGISLAIVSTLLMPVFGVWKKRLGVQLESAATTGEAVQNILCAYLSLAILLGLLANAAQGLWWADPVVALIVAVVAVQTGVKTWRGESCETVC
jgi:divalent metal cation (Fe/Co/Zn/Cd) transporter